MISIPIEHQAADWAGAREVRRLIKQAAFFLIMWLFGIGRIQGGVGAWVCIVLGLAEIAIWIKFVATGSF